MGKGGRSSGAAGPVTSTSSTAAALTSAAAAALPPTLLFTRIDGRLYDISSFTSRHPGGSDLLMMCAGRDASILVASYHRRNAAFRAVLGTLPEVPARYHAAAHALISLDSHSIACAADYSGLGLQSDLYEELKNRVNAHFAGRTSLRGGSFMLAKSIALLALIAAVYVACVVRGNFFLSPLVGMLFAIAGLSIQHDANHGALGSPLVNSLLGAVDDVIGGSALCWRTQHVVGHHQHPNEDLLDADSYSNWPLLRFNPALPRRWWHAAQHVYGPFLYCFLGIAFPLGDLTDVLRGRHEHIPLPPLRKRDVLQFVLGKVVHYVLTLGLPIYLWGWQTGLLHVWLPLQMAGGLFLASSFAVSHNTGATEYNIRATHLQSQRSSQQSVAVAASGASSPKPPRMCWAEMQIRSSANWSVDSTPAWLLWGGLNLQIEHHLMPSAAHEHLPAISVIVRQLCAERGIPYTAYDSFADIFAAHIRHLYALGHQDSVRAVETGGGCKCKKGL